MMKALSPLIAVTILVVISLTLASLVGPWMYELVTSTANETGTDVQTQIKCRKAGLGFDSEYGSYGVEWNFTGNASDWLKAKVVNTGNIDIHGFSFEVTLDSTAGEEIRHYDPTPATQHTEADPLRAARSAVIQANITQDINETIYTLHSVRVLNTVCKDLAPLLTV